MASANGEEIPHRAESVQSLQEEAHRKMSTSGLHMYEILGVDKSTATQDDIKRAYRRLALKFHPDKNNEPEAAEKFKEINYANRILSNETKKKIYDSYGSMGLHMAETLGEDNMGAFLLMKSPWLKALICCCCLFSGCCFGCFCCCFCCCNYCCGKFAPKHEDFGDFDDVEKGSHQSDDQTPIITSEPIIQHSLPDPNGASANPGVIVMPYHPDSNETKPNVIALPMDENIPLNSPVKNNSYGTDSQSDNLGTASIIAHSNSSNHANHDDNRPLTHANQSNEIDRETAIW